MNTQNLAYKPIQSNSIIKHTVTHKATTLHISSIGKQRVLSLILMATSIVSVAVTKDITASVLLVPASVGILLSNKQIINIERV